MGDTLRAVVTGVGRYVPPKCLTNQDLEKSVETTDQWIQERTGIKQRYVCPPDMATSDLAVEAGKRALEDAGVTAAEIELIIMCTTTTDMSFPSTGNLVQHRLGATKAGAFDLSCGCAGFVYGLCVASQFIVSGTFKKILVIGADTLSRIMDWTDRRTCVLFGDGAGAAVVEGTRDGYGIVSISLKSDGGGGDLLKLPAGGSRLPPSHETVDGKKHFIHMNGSEVFKFAVKAIADTTLEVLAKTGLGPTDVDLFIPHQANSRIIENAAKRAGIPMDKVYMNVSRYGNTSCGSIPIALSEVVERGMLKCGDLLVLCGFGAGLSWGATVIRWCPTRSLRSKPIAEQALVHSDAGALAGCTPGSAP